jgi:hypothetical protein
MLLHWIFVLGGLIQIQKRIQNPFENFFENFEKKKKKSYLLLSDFGPAIRPGLLPPSLPLGLSPFVAQLHRVALPAPRHGPSLAAGPARARAPASAFPSLTLRARMSGSPSSPHRHRFFFPKITDAESSSQSSSSLFGATPGLYKSGAELSRIHLVLL